MERVFTVYDTLGPGFLEKSRKFFPGVESRTKPGSATKTVQSFSAAGGLARR